MQNNGEDRRCDETGCFVIRESRTKVLVRSSLRVIISMGPARTAGGERGASRPTGPGARDLFNGCYGAQEGSAEADLL
jgi:hypothetical protein